MHQLANLIGQYAGEILTAAICTTVALLKRNRDLNKINKEKDAESHFRK